MPRELCCPHCKKPVDMADAPFDSHGNLVCKFCIKTVFPSTESAEADMKKRLPPEASYLRKEPVGIRL